MYVNCGGIYVIMFLSSTSTASTGPISWLVDGPQTLHHDFSASFCEISLKMHIYNSSGATAFVRIDTLDSAGNGGHVPGMLFLTVLLPTLFHLLGHGMSWASFQLLGVIEGIWMEIASTLTHGFGSWQEGKLKDFERLEQKI